MIPRTTDPMTKFIRTGEGVLVFGFNLALLVVPIVSGSLSAAQSAKWATIIDGIAVVSRTGLKMVASAQAKPPRVAAAAALEVAATTAYSLADGGAAGTAGVGTTASETAGETAATVFPKVAAALAPEISAIGRLVADAEEFADPPPAAQSQPAPSGNSTPAGMNGQPQFPLVGTNSSSGVPFLTQLGG
jgi:hypothetical protein